MLSIKLLGRFEVHLQGEPVDIPYRPAQSLLAFLILNAGAEYRREHLAGMLWPDSDETTARANLRQILWRLRKAIGDGHLVTSKVSVAFDASADHWLDVSLIKTEGYEGWPLSRLLEAISAYEGELLPGFYDDWIVQERVVLRSAFERKMNVLLARLLNEHRWADVVEWGEHWLSVDQAPETAYRSLMVAHRGLGDLKGVAAVYQRCVRTLRDEYEVEPSADTSDLFERLRSDRWLPTRIEPEQPISAVDRLASRHNLPAHTTPFVGREKELAELSDLLDDPSCRLVTVLGAGGMGKTRLALEAAAAQMERHEHGVYLVSLADLTSVEEMLTAIADAVGFQFYPGDDPKHQLLNSFRQKSILLVLDSFEHLLEGAALASEILQACPGVSVLATSREALNLQGETICSLGGMSFPPQGATDDVLAYDAGRLFMQSARRARLDFEPDADDGLQMARICQMVEGMPLAIEQAGAWLEMLSPTEIARELQQGLDILATQARDVPERHRSIRAVFDHSWSLLAQEEREVLRRLAVFRDGFTREAAAHVTKASLGNLLSLVNKSLIGRDPNTGLYTMHELLRQFAADKLKEDPAEEGDARNRHAGYFTEWVHENEHRLRAGEQREALLQMRNLRTAWRHSVQQHKWKAIGKCLQGFEWLYEFRSWHQEGEDVFSMAAEALRSGEDDRYALAILGQVLVCQATMTSQLGAFADAQAMTQEGLDLLRMYADNSAKALGYDFAAIMNMWWGDYTQADQLARESLSLFQSLNLEWGIGLAMLRVGAVHQHRGEFVEAKEYFKQSLEINRRINDRRGEGWALHRMAEVALAMGEYDQAHELLSKSLSLLSDIGYHYLAASAMIGLARLAMEKGELALARDYYLDGLNVGLELGYRSYMATGLINYAGLLVRCGRREDAVRHLSLALSNKPTMDDDIAQATSLLEALEKELPPEVFAAEVERGKALQLDVVVAELVGNRDQDRPLATHQSATSLQ